MQKRNRKLEDYPPATSIGQTLQYLRFEANTQYDKHEVTKAKDLP